MSFFSRSTLVPLAVLGSLAACADTPLEMQPKADRGVLAASSYQLDAASMVSVSDPAAAIALEMETANARLAAAGANLRVGKAELMLGPGASESAGTTVFANDRTKLLPFRWVPNDQRRLADGTNLTYLVDESRSFAFTRASPPPTPAYLGEVLATTFAPWQAVACSDLELVRRPDTGADPSILFGNNGNPFLADIVEAGFRPLPANVLGVTFTLIFVDDSGAPTDIDSDGRLDTALKEIWYSLGFFWSADAGPRAIDLPSVAIHENGHALEIGHFGKLFRTDANGFLHFAPRASMNAAYVAPDRNLYGTDVASYCGNFATWPD